MSEKRRTIADEPFLVIRSSALDVPHGHEIGRHRHDWHQLIYAQAGAMTVSVPAGLWIVPPERAVWAPAGTTHSIRFVGRARLRTLYLMPGWNGSLPADCCVIAVSPLLAALTVRAAELGMLDRRVPNEERIASLIVDELRRAETPPFSLPQPASAALRRAAELIMDPRRRAASPASLARAAGLGQRTLERRFLAETGITLGRWRRQHALLAALERIAAGEAVKAAAAEAGYATPSAFVAAFRAAFGTTPGRYLRS